MRGSQVSRRVAKLGHGSSSPAVADLFGRLRIGIVFRQALRKNQRRTGLHAY
jgi:hypothetical protein